MIETHLPAFYEAFGKDPNYDVVLRSFMWRGHEAAWVEAEGTIVFDFEDRGREGQPFTVRDFVCECMFTRGVGWSLVRGQLIQHPNETYAFCQGRHRAAYQRWQELNGEYQRLLTSPTDSLLNHCGEITLDLINKVKAGVFIGESAGAMRLWGGYFFLPTLAQVIGVSQFTLRPYMHQLEAAGLITLHEDAIRLPAIP